jgi:hypothetical protein
MPSLNAFARIKMTPILINLMKILWIMLRGEQV